MSDKDSHLAQQIQLAKRVYTMSLYERLAIVDELSKKKESLSDFLYACKRVCASALEQSARKDQTATTKSWHTRLKTIISAEESLRSNPNSKLLLTDLMLSI